MLDGMIPRNVCDAVKAPQAHKKEIEPLSPDQVRSLLSAARGDRLEALYVVAVHTGLRQGELLGLKWPDVDLDAGTVSVQRSLDADGSFNPPKRNKSRRTVKLTSAAVEVLKTHKAAQNEERLRLGSLWEDRNLVFPNRTGKPMVVLTRVGGQIRVSDVNADEGSAHDAGSNTKLPARIQTRSRSPRPLLAEQERCPDSQGAWRLG